MGKSGSLPVWSMTPFLVLKHSQPVVSFIESDAGSQGAASTAVLAVDTRRVKRE